MLIASCRVLEPRETSGLGISMMIASCTVLMTIASLVCVDRLYKEKDPFSTIDQVYQRHEGPPKGASSEREASQRTGTGN